MKATDIVQHILMPNKYQIRFDFFFSHVKGCVHQCLSIDHNPVFIPYPFYVILVGFTLFSCQSQPFNHLAELTHVEAIGEMVEEPYRGQVL